MTAINFPAGAASGATHTEAGITWTFDGTVWDSKVADTFVNTTGDTMTGNLTVPSLNGGQLAGFRNILINGNLKINQRGVTIAAAAVGAYGPDRWKKVDAGNMTQIIEDGNFVPGATYTLSGTGVTTQQLTAPASGNWTLPNIPIAATNVQLEFGTVATPFEHRPIGVELQLCQRYYQETGLGGSSFVHEGGSICSGAVVFPIEMRGTPTTSVIPGRKGSLRFPHGTGVADTVALTPGIANPTSSPTGLWTQVSGFSVGGQVTAVFGRFPDRDYQFISLSAEL